MTKNPIRRYFKVEGEPAEACKQALKIESSAYHERKEALRAKYQADALMLRNGLPVSLLLDPEKTPPDGVKHAGTHTHEGKRYVEWRPMMNRRAGKIIKADFNAVGEFSGNEKIRAFFKVDRMVYGNDGSMWVSTAGIVKDTVVVQIPTDDESVFEPPAGFVEIKKSEFIALTEE